MSGPVDRLRQAFAAYEALCRPVLSANAGTLEAEAIEAANVEVYWAIAEAESIRRMWERGAKPISGE